MMNPTRYAVIRGLRLAIRKEGARGVKCHSPCRRPKTASGIKRLVLTKKTRARRTQRGLGEHKKIQKRHEIRPIKIRRTEGKKSRTDILPNEFGSNNVKSRTGRKGMAGLDRLVQEAYYKLAIQEDSDIKRETKGGTEW